MSARAVGMSGPPAGLSWMSAGLADRLSNTTASDTELAGRPGSRASQRRETAGSPGLPPPAYPGPLAGPLGGLGGPQRELPGLPGQLPRTGPLRRDPAGLGDPLHHRSTPPVIGQSRRGSPVHYDIILTCFSCSQ